VWTGKSQWKKVSNVKESERQWQKVNESDESERKWTKVTNRNDPLLKQKPKEPLFKKTTQRFILKDKRVTKVKESDKQWKQWKKVWISERTWQPVKESEQQQMTFFCPFFLLFAGACGSHFTWSRLKATLTRMCLSYHNTMLCKCLQVGTKT